MYTAIKRHDGRERQPWRTDLAGAGGPLLPPTLGAAGPDRGRETQPVVPGPTADAEEAAGLKREIEALRARLAGLNEATLRITEDLDLGAVLQGVIDGARSLIGARYGALMIHDRFADVEDLITSGITPEQMEAIKTRTREAGFHGFLNEMKEPLRLRDIADYAKATGSTKTRLPRMSFLGTPVRHRGERLGNIYLAEKEDGPEFTPEDEETLAVFASHAATAIFNASRYAEEARAKADLEALNERFSSLCEAVLILSESLDVDTILDRIVVSAKLLTGARNGLITTLDESGQLVDFYTTGFTPEDHQALLDVPQGLEIQNYFHELRRPLRVPDVTAHLRALGFSGPLPMGAVLSTPMYFRGACVGNLSVANKEGGGEFTEGDEELMNVLASQAAVAIANARAYQSEHQAKADMEALVNASPVGVLVFDAKTLDLVSLNDETRRIVRGQRAPSYSRADLLNVMSFRRPDGQEIPPEELPTARAVRDGETVRADEVIIKLSDGQAVSTIVNATPVFSEEGEVVSVIATLQDMTPLERLERLRSEFIGMVSHELRTPLAAIKGSAASVLGGSSKIDHGEMRRFFRVIDEQADQMRSLIGDILDTAQIDAGALSVTTEPADVAELVEEARRAFLRTAATNVIEAELPPDLPPVSVDRQRMLQVLNNLFTYASIYSPFGSTIRVSASVGDVYVSISVTDAGKGVSAERLPHLFRKFYPSDPKDEYEAALVQKPGPTALTAGEGLSLVICKGIVEAHGGRIWAESDGRGRGTRITFTVPSAEEAGSSRLADEPERTSYRGTVEEERGQERILIVDDEPRLLPYLRKILREAGYVPVAAGNPEEAERLIEAGKPHLVLLNPALGGDEMIDGVRALTGAPVIFLSEQGADGDAALALDIGADDYILKPFSPTELVARIRAALRRQSASERERTRESYQVGDLTIDYSERRVTVAGQPVQLTSTEYRLLFDLSVNAGKVLTHDQLLRRVWGPGYEGDTQPVRTFVKSLRRKLGDDARSPAYIFTEPRVGYRMAKPEGGAVRRML